MKKENIHKFLFSLSALLLSGFAITFGVDAYKYHTGVYIGSAPLYLYALARAVTYILPSILVFVTAIFVKKKFANKEKKENQENKENQEKE